MPCTAPMAKVSGFSKGHPSRGLATALVVSPDGGPRRSIPYYHCSGVFDSFGNLAGILRGGAAPDKDDISVRPGDPVVEPRKLCMAGPQKSPCKPGTVCLGSAPPKRTALRKQCKTGRISHALVAQLDRASDYESEGWRFESFRARHSKAP